MPISTDYAAAQDLLKRLPSVELARLPTVIEELPRLAAGRHRVTLSYLGTKTVDGVARKVTVKVVRPPSRTS